MLPLIRLQANLLRRTREILMAGTGSELCRAEQFRGR